MLRAVRRGVGLSVLRAPPMAALRANLLTVRDVNSGVGIKVPRALTLPGVRHFSPPPPPPPDAAAALEELVTHRVREKVQGDLRQDRQELQNTLQGIAKSLNDKIGGVEKNLNDKIGGVEKNLNIKIDATKTETSLQAAAYAFAGATLAVTTLGFVLRKR